MRDYRLFYRIGIGLRVGVIYVPSLSWLVAEPGLNSKPDPIPEHSAALIGRDLGWWLLPCWPQQLLKDYTRPVVAL